MGFPAEHPKRAAVLPAAQPTFPKSVTLQPGIPSQSFPNKGYPGGQYPVNPPKKSPNVGLIVGLSLGGLALLIGLLVLIPVILRGASHSNVLASRHSSYVIFELWANDSMEGSWDSCHGTGGYSDIHAGMGSRLEDQNGNVVGSLNFRNLDATTFNRLQAQNNEFGSLTISDLQEAAQRGILCVLVASAEVEDAEYYSLEVTHRGAITFSRDELRENSWFFRGWVGDRP